MAVLWVACGYGRGKFGGGYLALGRLAVVGLTTVFPVHLRAEFF